jgi:anti-sigma factor RsiW
MFLGGRKRRCHKVRGMLSEYIDNYLDSEDRGVVEHHLGICESCSNELESLQMTVRLLKQVPQVPAPRSFAISEVETGRVSVFEPRRLGWLRPATAFATVALIALLIVDFLQVVPHDHIMLSPTPQGEEYMLDSRGGEPAETLSEPTPEPAPVIGEEAPTEDINSGVTGMGVTYGGEEEVSGESEAGWPLRQLEIAIGVLVFALVALMLFARRQRRRWSRA